MKKNEPPLLPVRMNCIQNEQLLLLIAAFIEAKDRQRELARKIVDFVDPLGSAGVDDAAAMGVAEGIVADKVWKLWKLAWADGGVYERLNLMNP